MAIVITKQPTNVAANVNDTVSITLEATGDGLVYDWQYSTNGTKFYSLSASASASDWTHDQPTLTFKCYSGYLKYYFRCKITDANGDSVFSNIVRAINLAEAGAGFILPDTLHSLAEAIRAKTETTDKILPADMAAMIDVLDGGGVYAGTFTTRSGASSGATYTISLGMTLPEYDDYGFLVFSGDDLCWKLIRCLDGEVTDKYSFSPQGKNAEYALLGTSDIVLNAADGTISYTGNGQMSLSTTYEWLYINLKGVYSE